MDIYKEKLPQSGTAEAERIDAEDSKNNMEQQRQNTIADKIAATINARPPVIGELIQADDSGIEIKIPLGGDTWKEISNKTGEKTTHGMKERLREIAKRGNLDIIFGEDDDGVGDTVKILKKPGITYEKFMDGDALAFIECFEFHAIRR